MIYDPELTINLLFQMEKRLELLNLVETETKQENEKLAKVRYIFYNHN